MPLRHSMRSTFRDRARIQPVRRGPGRANKGPVTGPGQRPGIRREFLIDRTPVVRRQARRLTHQQRGPPLTQLPRFQGSKRVRHLRHQSLRQTQQPAPLRRRLPPGQRHLRPDTRPELVCRDPGNRLRPALQHQRPPSTGPDGQPTQTSDPPTPGSHRSCPHHRPRAEHRPAPRPGPALPAPDHSCKRNRTPPPVPASLRIPQDRPWLKCLSGL